MAEAHRLRQADLADTAKILALDQVCFPPGDRDREPASTAELETAIRRGRVSVLTDHGDLVGYLHVERTSRQAHLRAVGVRPDVAGSGFAGQLLDHWLWSCAASATRPDALMAVTSPRNVPMLRALFRRGFVVREVLTAHFGATKDRLALQFAPELRPVARSVERVAVDDLAGLERMLLADDVVLTGYHGEDVDYFDVARVPHWEPQVRRRNEYYPWDDFDADDYYSHNYRELHPDDGRIIDFVSRFFAAAGVAPGSRGIDVGSGTNLYPALLMLPFCRALTLWERSVENVAWLRRQIGGYAAEWDPFWDRMSASAAPWKACAAPRDALTERASALPRSVFELPPRVWDVGTMFFVAESISTDPDDFRDAILHFLAALRPGAPFAMTFMAKSEGYVVGTRAWPAVSVGPDEVEEFLRPLCTGLDALWLPIAGNALRPGYSGMIVACGYAR